MKTVKRWKFICKGFKSKNGDCKWEIGEWAEPIKKLELCSSGYHCSKSIYQAFSHVQEEILCEVECKGKHLSEDDEETWSEQRVIRAWKWTKKDTVALSIYVAELCIENFEKVYPNDKRPREAIEAAKRWLKKPSSVNRSAVESAWYAAESAKTTAKFAAESTAESTAESARSAVWSAKSAWHAIGSAVWSARSAVWSAESAVWSAVWSARYAAESAESAVWSAESTAESAESTAESARSALIQKISKWMDNHLSVLKEIK